MSEKKNVRSFRNNGPKNNKKKQNSIPKGKKKFLFFSTDIREHINPLIGIADYLRDCGHETVFLMDTYVHIPGHKIVTLAVIKEESENENFRIESIKSVKERTERAVEIGKEFCEKITNEVMSDLIENDPGFLLLHEIFRRCPRAIKSDKWEELQLKIPFMIDSRMFKCTLPLMRNYLQQNRPDVIICCHLQIIPPLMSSDKCWVRVHTMQPLDIWHHYHPDRLPPPLLGLPTNLHQDEIEQFREHKSDQLKKRIENLEKYWPEYKSIIDQYEIDERLRTESPWLNIYMYPRILDYDRVCGGLKLPKHWLRCEELVNRDSQQFEIPAKFKSMPGSLIYVSMGQIESMEDVDTLRRLVRLLAKLPHKFIVAKGQHHEKFGLAPNMWGDGYVPQLAILPQVDLVITSGTNNTIVECLYFGVPGLIVLPIAADQLDNAQRIEELELGVRLDILKISPQPACIRKPNKDEDLGKAIEFLLKDGNLKQRMKKISKELQSNNGPKISAKRIEQLAYQPIKTKQ